MNFTQFEELKKGDYVEQWDDTHLISTGYVVRIAGRRVYYEDSSRKVFCHLYSDLVRGSAIDEAIFNPTSVEDCEAGD
jgi:hypothetical protein